MTRPAIGGARGAHSALCTVLLLMLPTGPLPAQRILVRGGRVDLSGGATVVSLGYAPVTWGPVSLFGAGQVVAGQDADLYGLTSGAEFEVNAHWRLSGVRLAIPLRRSTRSRSVAPVQPVTPAETPALDMASDSVTDARVLTLVSIARKAMETPYLWGGSDANRFDCSGLVQ